MTTAKLPPETAALWLQCKDEPLLAHSYLLGGTALALQIQHRISEDLDFFYALPKLPCEDIAAFLEKLTSSGSALTMQTHWPTYDEFQIAGENLYDHHQVWLVNAKTKISFTTFGAGTVKLLDTPASARNPVVPTVRELFATKAVLVSQRNKTRDWLDLYILLRAHHFTAADFIAAYDKVGKPERGMAELKKLSTLSAPNKDEGYTALIMPPPTLEDMREFFAKLYADYQCR
ncbi:MAG: nucleotidyl transferase AbiEii/AbiGii toxin family protein [Verrucomicrobiales bacterium]|nr:nucleotidyl transferase AbiEii/AbiGii toxin family protein [Verrucomicrobiales bacterium]